MSYPDNSGADPVALRLKPEYWDGEVFGQGEVNEPNYSERMPRAVKRFALTSLSRYLARPEGRMSLGAIAEGDTFDPNEYALGTIVALNQEELITLPNNAFIKGEMPEGPTPVPNRTIPYSKDQVGKTMEVMGLGSTGYAQWTEWGVVVSSRWGKSHHLFTPANLEIMNETVPAVRMPALYAGSITIGKVLHHGIDKVESLRRTNALEICARGKPKSRDHDDSRPWRFRPEFGRSS